VVSTSFVNHRVWLLNLPRCGDATYETSGYVSLQKDASKYNIPIFFSETGCNVGAARTFDDQAAIFGDKMVNTWSGAIIYEWIQETNNYGLVDYGFSQPASANLNDASFGRNGTPIPRNPDFENLSKHWATLTPTGVRADDYKPSLSPPPCPEFTSGAWEVKANAQLPTVGYESEITSASSGSDVPTSIATASGKANAGTGEPTSSQADANGVTPAATSSAAANGMTGSKVSLDLWVGGYVALCVVAGVFSVF
jgi:hypothetical protein